MKPDELPDRSDIEAIQRALWDARSRAAIMVGAGFSRNATPISAGARPFALWPDVTKRFCQDLRGQDPRFGDDSMRLAQEYADSFGRDVLDSVLLEAIPDESHEPGPLHQLLACLPWTD